MALDWADTAAAERCDECGRWVGDCACLPPCPSCGDDVGEVGPAGLCADCAVAEDDADGDPTDLRHLPPWATRP
jgi:hypothetical protein